LFCGEVVGTVEKNKIVWFWFWFASLI